MGGKTGGALLRKALGAERGVVNCSYEGRVARASEPARGDANSPEGDERRGWRWSYMRPASAMAFSRIQRWLCETVVSNKEEKAGCYIFETKESLRYCVEAGHTDVFSAKVGRVSLFTIISRASLHKK